jgi:hypothetical protein
VEGISGLRCEESCVRSRHSKETDAIEPSHESLGRGRGNRAAISDCCALLAPLQGAASLGGRDPVVYAQLTLCSNHRLISGIPKGCLTHVIHARLANVSFLIARWLGTRALAGFLTQLEPSLAGAPILRGKESRCDVRLLRVPRTPSGCGESRGTGSGGLRTANAVLQPPANFMHP